ncbi:unnamed protein product [Strongylus vulgaris]|uniref:Uncharacterized protein n=1 Tax=Strongylus vulgaris TaxID=40348 RepID=A0A3P7JNI4_STRVU|nr:unnamed protein product [Strongylus vulgaris]
MPFRGSSPKRLPAFCYNTRRRNPSSSSIESLSPQLSPISLHPRHSSDSESDVVHIKLLFNSTSSPKLMDTPPLSPEITYAYPSAWIPPARTGRTPWVFSSPEELAPPPLCQNINNRENPKIKVQISRSKPKSREMSYLRRTLSDARM